MASEDNIEAHPIWNCRQCRIVWWPVVVDTGRSVPQEEGVCDNCGHKMELHQVSLPRDGRCWLQMF